MRYIRINKFVAEEDHIDWLIADLLPNVGWTLLVGRQGLGKSTFAMQMCAALQAGCDFLHRKVIRTNILYIQADSPTLEWREMLKRIAPDSTGFTIVDVPTKCLGNPEYVNDLVNLKTMVKPGFIVFDSLYNLTAWPINSESVMMPINQMKQIADTIPWLLIHHPPQGESRAAGHHSLPANCSNEWHLLKNKMAIVKGRLVKDKEILLSRDKEGLWLPKEVEESDDDDLMHKALF